MLYKLPRYRIPHGTLEMIDGDSKRRLYNTTLTEAKYLKSLRLSTLFLIFLVCKENECVKIKYLFKLSSTLGNIAREIIS
jgi:hypothetical protein